MNIDEFIKRARSARFPQRAYVEEPGWTELYVRYTQRYVPEGWFRSLDLAKLEAEQPGKGTFKDLVNRLRREYADLLLYVECVNEPRLRPGLLRMGFLKKSRAEESYYLLPAIVRGEK